MVIPALAIMNLTVWSFPPRFRFIADLRPKYVSYIDAAWTFHAVLLDICFQWEKRFD